MGWTGPNENQDDMEPEKKNKRGNIKWFKPLHKCKHYEYHPNRRIMFGMYAGTKYCECPSYYLQWFAKSAYKQMVNRKNWAIAELKRRGEWNE